MGCIGCGKKEHKGRACSQPAAVIKIDNPSELILFHKVIIPASMGDESQTPVTIGKYCNVLMVYEANGHAYLYSSDGIPTKIAFDSGGVLLVDKMPEVEQASVGFLYIDKDGNAAITGDNQEWVIISGAGGANDFEKLINRPKYAGQEMTGSTDIPDWTNEISNIKSEMEEVNDSISSLSAETESLSSLLSAEAAAREAVDINLQSQIDAISAASDVKDVVGTHADLENYDTSGLSNNDIIKVLDDETQDDKVTYYRWSASAGTFELIGSEGPYYTKAQTDTLLNAKQDELTAGENITIIGNVISATGGTNYIAGNGILIEGNVISTISTVFTDPEWSALWA